MFLIELWDGRQEVGKGINYSFKFFQNLNYFMFIFLKCGINFFLIF